MTSTFYTGGLIFDGAKLHRDMTLEVIDNRIVGLTDAPPPAGPVVDLDGDILGPGFVDLQVNGGGGVFLGERPDALEVMAAAHRRLGTTNVMPTLITDTPERMARVLARGTGGVSGVAGVHLEGPHLDPRKAGAHDPAMIRPMGSDDLALYCDAAQRMPLKITLAPEAATPEQIASLCKAGVTVFLGHSGCDYETAATCLAAGAKGVTHLWNAMSPMTSRSPGLVGAALGHRVACGIIADGHHVHPATLRASLSAARGPVFLVSDAMSCAATDQTMFYLGGREVLRSHGALRLSDGTLAGADLDLRRAVEVMVSDVGVPLGPALAMATSVPADVMGLAAGRIAPGRPADLIRLSPDLARLSVL